MINRIRPLDRFVFDGFAKIFGTTVLCFPLLIILFDLTDNLEAFFGRELTMP